MTRVLLDENFPLRVADGLALAGHEVLTVAALAPAIDDHGVLALARREACTLLTFDADFGDLIFQRGEAPPQAIIYFRIHPVIVADLLALALSALAQATEGHFIGATREGLRRRRFDAVDAGGRP